MLSVILPSVNMLNVIMVNVMVAKLYNLTKNLTRHGRKLGPNSVKQVLPLTDQSFVPTFNLPLALLY
jgi:hypothetical protein